MTGFPYTCVDLQQAGLQVACCLSCHAEAARGGQPLLDACLPDGSAARCCCAVASALCLAAVGYQQCQALINQLPLLERWQPAPVR